MATPTKANEASAPATNLKPNKSTRRNQGISQIYGLVNGEIIEC